MIINEIFHTSQRKDLSFGANYAKVSNIMWNSKNPAKNLSRVLNNEIRSGHYESASETASNAHKLLVKFLETTYKKLNINPVSDKKLKKFSEIGTIPYNLGNEFMQKTRIESAKFKINNNDKYQRVFNSMSTFIKNLSTNLIF